MNPLIPTNAIQMRYISPVFEPIYDEEDNAVDEECVRRGTDILYEFITPTSKDRIPRYYRLRYRENAKDHKRRWEKWLELNLVEGNTPYFVKVTKIGRRVLFEYDSALVEKREKKLKAIKHKEEMKARKLARQAVPAGTGPQENESWDEWLVELERTSIEREQYENDEELLIEEEDDNELNYQELDNLVGESEQGEAVYENRESGDRYEER